MNIINRKVSFIFFITLLLVALTSCSNATEGNKPSNEGSKPSPEANQQNDEIVGEVEDITISFAAPWGDELFESGIKSIVEEEFPHITMELIPTIVAAHELEELFAKEIIPDILHAHRGFGVLDDAEMIQPLDDFVEKHALDLESFAPGMIDTLRKQDPDGEGRLLGIPIEQQPVVLFYNKEIFDKAGLDYPVDGMTWNETIALAEKLSREQDGVDIHGLFVNGDLIFDQLSQHGTDPETGEVLFTKEPNFNKWLSLIEEINAIPGNYTEAGESSFFEQETAMFVATSAHMVSLLKMDGFEFDVVSMPSWSDIPNTTRAARPYPFTISPYSENKDEAFKVLKFLASKESQLNLSRTGTPSSLADIEVQEQYTADLIEDDRVFNIGSALTFNEPAAPKIYSPWDEKLGAFVAEKAREFNTSEDDVNTFLRKMEDEYSIIVEELRAQQ